MRRRYKKSFKRFVPKNTTIGQKAYTLASRALGAVKKVKKSIGNVENKTAYGLGNAINVTNALTFDNLHSIAQGDGNGQRIGDKITIKKIGFKWYVTMDANEVSNQIRFMIIRWLDDSTPAASDILASTSTVRSFLNRQHTRQFTVLWSKMIELDQAKSYSQGGEKYIPIEIEAVYKGSAGSDQAFGKIYFAYMAEYVSTAPVAYYSSCVDYVDT